MVIDPNQLNVNETIRPLNRLKKNQYRFYDLEGLGIVCSGSYRYLCAFVTQLAVATAFIVVNIASGNLDLLRIADSLENGLAMSVTVIVSAIVESFSPSYLLRCARG